MRIVNKQCAQAARIQRLSEKDRYDLEIKV